MLNQFPSAEFYPGEPVISITHHPPEVRPGASANIVKPWAGNLCSVQLPDGMIHNWFASFELRPLNSYSNLNPGSQAQIISAVGHPPHIKAGTIVRIVRCIPTTFYDVILSNGEYHRWLADFELARPI